MLYIRLKEIATQRYLSHEQDTVDISDIEFSISDLQEDNKYMSNNFAFHIELTLSYAILSVFFETTIKIISSLQGINIRDNILAK